MQYERPKIVDYGTLQQLTLGGTLTNADTPAGISNTAYPVHS